MHALSTTKPELDWSFPKIWIENIFYIVINLKHFHSSEMVWITKAWQWLSSTQTESKYVYKPWETCNIKASDKDSQLADSIMDP